MENLETKDFKHRLKYKRKLITHIVVHKVMSTFFYGNC